MQRLGSFYYSLQTFFGCKAKLGKASIVYHIGATGCMKKLEALEVSLLAHIANLKKICLKMKDFDIFQKKVNFPSMQRLGSFCYSLQIFLGCKEKLLKVSFIYHTRATRLIKTLEELEVSLLAHIANLLKISLQRDFIRCLRLKNEKNISKSIANMQMILFLVKV